jgi:hypothetical protein
MPLHANLMPLSGVALVWMIASRLQTSRLPDDQSTIRG